MSVEQSKWAYTFRLRQLRETVSIAINVTEWGS
jgi:hypothetical protein